MEIQLKRLRKAAGYTSRQSLADKLDINVRTLKAWELQEVRMSLEDACRVADLLDCTLDELAGRPAPPAPALSPDESRTLEKYRALTPSRQAAANDMLDGLAAKSQASAPASAPSRDAEPERKAV